MLNEEVFTVFGTSHLAALVVWFFLTVTLLLWVRKEEKKKEALTQEQLEKKTNSAICDKILRWGMATFLFYTPLGDMLHIYLRYGEEGFSYIHNVAYPLFLCDVVAIILAIALLKKSQRLSEIGYLWAMAGTAQGMLTPVLYFDFPSLEYFSFFLQHGLAPTAAILLTWGYQLKPKQGAYKRAWLWTWVYVGLVMLLNKALNTNYGFFNEKPSVPTAFDLLGPYPWYLLSLHGVAAIVYFLLLLPFYNPAKRKFTDFSDKKTKSQPNASLKNKNNR